MSDLNKAKDLLRNTEARLRDLMAIALSEQRYLDVAAVAPIADAVSNLSGRESPPISTTVADVKQTEVQQVASAQARKKSTKTDDYPRFERDGEKLVKIAWSKKDRREYEHRAPYETVLAVAERLTSSDQAGGVFSMDTMMPFKTSDGSEIPSYQAYLALAWFRTFGAVEQRGKDGYSVQARSLDRPNIEAAWHALHSR